MTSNAPAAPSNVPADILVVDDEPDLRTLYELTLLREGHNVSAAGSLTEARALLAQHGFDVVITDMRLPDGLGLELLRELAQAQRPERCIVITAYGSAENAVEALKHGAFDYLTKPVDLKQFRTVVRAAQATPGATASAASEIAPEAVSETAPASASVPIPGAPGAETAASPHLPVQPQPFGAPARETAAPPRPATLPDTPLPISAPPNTPSRAEQTPAARALARMVGDSPVMQAVKSRIARVARSMAPVLVHGESGTGKELVARALHDCSHRANGPFVAVNCGAIPENLLEAEFFGARKGAYTGATQDRDGFFQAARGGTLFLDEIGDLPLPMQAKLLRAIQERSIRPLGETQEEAVDVRFVSATHKDLAAEVQAGRFRQDLYYRLNVIEIVVPPLRERRADLPLLTRTLLARIARETGLPALDPTPRLLAELQTAQLPGNVRELENILHRAIALGGIEELGDPAGLAAIAPMIQPPPQPPAPPPQQPPRPVVSQPIHPLFQPRPHPFSTPLVAPAASLPAAPPIAAPGANPLAPIQPGPSPAGPEAPNIPLDPARLPSDLIAWLDEQERRVLVRALEQTGFNRTAAAARLGLNLRQIRYRIARLGITEPGSDADENEDPEP